MAKYMVLGKYSPSGLEAVRRDGYASRTDGLRKWADSVGGNIECMYFMPSAEWDYVAIGDMDSDALFAIGSQGAASGAFERFHFQELRSAEEADRLVNKPVIWKPPTSSST